MTSRVYTLERRRRHHQSQLAKADSPTRRFDVAADWLMVEARRSGRLREVTGWLLARVEELQADARYGGESRAS